MDHSQLRSYKLAEVLMMQGMNQEHTQVRPLEIKDRDSAVWHRLSLQHKTTTMQRLMNLAVQVES